MLHNNHQYDLRIQQIVLALDLATASISSQKIIRLREYLV